MKAIGIRVAPQKIFYTIIEKEGLSDKLKFVTESLNLPKALSNDVPRQLSFIRTTLFSIICEHGVQFAGLRTAEGSAKTPSVFRMNMEGVIQELFSNSTIEDYFTGTLISIASRLNLSSKEIKDCCEGKSNLFNIDNWSKLNDNKRESFLAALAVLNQKEAV